MSKYEKQLTKHILNEKYLGEADDEKMTKEERDSFLEAVGNFHKLGEMVYGSGRLKEVAETLKSVVERAEKMTLSETENRFDNVTTSRHMNKIGESLSED